MPIPRILLACLALGSLFAAKGRGQVCKDMTYESRNQTDYGPLRVTVIRGFAKDADGMAVPNPCIGVFTEIDHKIVAAVRTDKNGRFEVNRVAAGRYRLVTKYAGVCVANARIRMQAGSRRGRPLFVHMRPAGIDTCSYVDQKQ